MSVQMQLVFVAATALLGAGIIIVVLAKMLSPRQRAIRSLLAEAEGKVAFLFDDTALVDATPAARSILARRDASKSDWDQFVSLFGPRFPGLRKELAHLASDGSRRITPTTPDGSYIDAEFWDGLARIVYVDTSEPAMSTTDQIAYAALEEEAVALRAIAEDAPQLIWKETFAGEILWANSAYLRLADQLGAPVSENERTWPPIRIFPDIDLPHQSDKQLVRRISTRPADGREPRWFEVTSVVKGAEIVHFGTDANAIVQADVMRRSFVQTMGNTFAQLSIGLAIFDKERRLMTFNPALADLTGLPVQFLTGRPQLQGFLDRLREMRMLPEPKNYSTWREDMAALELAAKHGTYCENWDIPNGQTFRVTGRPHPDGAIAFLIEDISAEVSLTRRFRSELEVSQGALDTMDEAIAVFSAAGTLTISNRAYCDLWAEDAAREFSDTGIVEQSRLWQQASSPSGVWGKVREFVGGFSDRKPQISLVSLLDGRQLHFRIVAMPGGGTLVGFKPVLEKTTDGPVQQDNHGGRELLTVAN